MKKMVWPVTNYLWHVKAAQGWGKRAMREERPEGWGWEGRMGIWRENPLELVIRLTRLFYFWWGRSSFCEHMHATRQGHRSRRRESQTKTLALRGMCSVPRQVSALTPLWLGNQGVSRDRPAATQVVLRNLKLPYTIPRHSNAGQRLWGQVLTHPAHISIMLWHIKLEYGFIVLVTTSLSR